MENKNGDWQKDGFSKGRLALAAGVIAAVAVGAWALSRSGVFAKARSREELQALLAQTGPWAGVVYFVLQVLSVIFAPIPSNVTIMAGAAVMGFWPAFLLGTAAICLSSMAVFLAARGIGRGAVRRFVDHGVMEKYMPLIEEKQDMFLFLTLLFPFFPDDVLCILAGVTSIPTGRFAILMALARPWGLAFAALMGSGVLNLPWWAIALVLAALAAVFVLAMKHSRRIEDWLLTHILKKSEEKKNP